MTGTIEKRNVKIVKQFNLSEGNELNCKIRAEGGELIIVVKVRRVDYG